MSLFAVSVAIQESGVVRHEIVLVPSDSPAEAQIAAVNALCARGIVSCWLQGPVWALALTPVLV